MKTGEELLKARGFVCKRIAKNKLWALLLVPPNEIACQLKVAALMLTAPDGGQSFLQNGFNLRQYYDRYLSLLSSASTVSTVCLLSDAEEDVIRQFLKYNVAPQKLVNTVAPAQSACIKDSMEVKFEADLNVMRHVIENGKGLCTHAKPPEEVPKNLKIRSKGAGEFILSWDVDEGADIEPIGLKWQNVGTKRPRGTPLNNLKLADELKRKTKFTCGSFSWKRKETIVLRL